MVATRRIEWALALTLGSALTAIVLSLLALASPLARAAPPPAPETGPLMQTTLVVTLDDEDVWTGAVPYTDTLSYFVQALDGAGNVGVDVNKAWYFGPGIATENDLYLPLIMRS